MRSFLFGRWDIGFYHAFETGKTQASTKGLTRFRPKLMTDRTYPSILPYIRCCFIKECAPCITRSITPFEKQILVYKGTSNKEGTHCWSTVLYWKGDAGRRSRLVG